MKMSSLKGIYRQPMVDTSGPSRRAEYNPAPPDILSRTMRTEPATGSWVNSSQAGANPTIKSTTQYWVKSLAELTRFSPHFLEFGLWKH